MKSKNKRYYQWCAIKRELYKLFVEKGITKCEVCHGREYVISLSFHHRHKRSWYYSKDKQALLGDFNEVLLVDQNCHYLLQTNNQLSNKWFKQLRGV